MTRKGRELEKLVKIIEQCFSPSEAIVKSPDYVQDVYSEQKREIDVTVRQKIGLHEYLVAIECRDRGIEDVTWVEQATEKFRAVRADKKILVSSKGFTEPAIQRAKINGIETYVLGDIDGVAIKSWFQPDFFIVTSMHAHHYSYTIDVKDAAALAAAKIDLAGPVFVASGGGQMMRFREFVDHLVNTNQKIFNDCEKSPGKKIRRTVHFNFPNPAFRYLINTDDRSFEITALELFADFWVEIDKIPPTKVFCYTDQVEKVVQGVEFEFSNKQHPMKKVSIIRDASTGKSVVHLEKAQTD